MKQKYAGRRGKCPECSSSVEVPTLKETLDLNDAGNSTVSGGDSSAVALDPSHPFPQNLGRFRIERVLGEGAFGAVYLVHDPQLDRPAALKVPHPETLHNKKRAERFLREARAAAQLHHPHIVPIYDAGEADGTYYIAAAYVAPGRTLGDELAEREKLPPARAAELIEQVASALHYAHALGIVHRDVKPDNVLLDEEGRPHVADFGLARRDEGEALLTQENARMGTPAYMSPEQHAGKSHQADARSDQWSLGVMLYEMLTGERPFQGNEMQLMYAVREAEPEGLRQRDAAIARDLETICLKCLSKEPAGRYATCGELAEDLRRWRSLEPITARRISAVTRVVRWCKRNPLPAGLIAAVQCLLLAIVVLSVFSYFADQAKLAQIANQVQQITQQNEQIEFEKERAMRGEKAATLAKSEAEAREEDARLRLYYARVQLAHSNYENNNIGRALDLLASAPEEHRHFEWGYLQGLCNGGLFTINGPPFYGCFVRMPQPQRQAHCLGKRRQNDQSVGRPHRRGTNHAQRAQP